MKKIKIVLIPFLSLFLGACSGFFDKDNTPTPSPLVKFNPEIKIQKRWSTSTNFGVGPEYLKMSPALTQETLYTASKDGTVTATNKSTGKTRWKVATKLDIGAGPAALGDQVIVSSREGDVWALQAANGQTLWRTRVGNEVLASPALSVNLVLVKTIDGYLYALSRLDGHELWRYRQTEPTLILHSGSAPLVVENSAIVGFANGNLTRILLQDGLPRWEHLVAIPEGSFAIQRMVDIDANPIVLHHRVYAATYQGRISALDFASGKNIWTHDFSTYTGLSVDSQHVFATDAKGYLWAFDSATGKVLWIQKQLESRVLSGPAILGQAVVVGDQEGYLHWVSKQDGHFLARVHVDNGAIIAAPLVYDDTLYVVSANGRLAAYQLG